jgi:branched-chain amino acid transport system substrate-binding protein
MDNIFISSAISKQEVEGIVQKLEELGLRRIALLSTTDQYGQGGAAALKEAEGLELVAAETMPLDVTDVTPQLTKIRSAKPEAVVVLGGPPSAGIAIKGAGELGIDVPILSGRVSETPDNVAAAGKSPALRNWLVQGVVDPEAPLPRQKQGVAEITKRFPDDPLLFTAAGWDAAQILAAGLKNAGDNADRAALRSGLEQVKDLAGVYGTYTFSRDQHYGVVAEDTLWFKARDGGFRLSETDS